jgi:hypothetical protein
VGWSVWLREFRCRIPVNDRGVPERTEGTLMDLVIAPLDDPRMKLVRWGIREIDQEREGGWKTYLSVHDTIEDAAEGLRRLQHAACCR